MLSLPYPHLHKTEEPALSTTWKDLHQLGVRGTEFSCVNALRLGDLLAVLVTSSLINTLPSDRSINTRKPPHLSKWKGGC